MHVLETDDQVCARQVLADETAGLVGREVNAESGAVFQGLGQHGRRAKLQRPRRAH